MPSYTTLMEESLSLSGIGGPRARSQTKFCVASLIIQAAGGRGPQAGLVQFIDSCPGAFHIPNGCRQYIKQFWALIVYNFFFLLYFISLVIFLSTMPLVPTGNYF